MGACVIGHIIGLDETSKQTLMKKIDADILVVDLDAIQQSVYNSRVITDLKESWSQISQEINTVRQQVRIVEEIEFSARNMKDRVASLLSLRNSIKSDILAEWRRQMIDRLEEIKLGAGDKQILYIGFNIYPKDYRSKIDLGLNIQCSDQPNRIIFDTEPGLYASNQIEYYLDHYRHRIIRGLFPHNLLKRDYLIARYNKFTDYYERIGYKYIDADTIPVLVTKLKVQCITK